jgi:hypothetical protein
MNGDEMAKKRDSKKNWRLISVYTPPEVDKQVRKLATENRRSLSAEIIYLLEQALSKDEILAKSST